jgi:insecticidal toxin complex protein TccC
MNLHSKTPQLQVVDPRALLVRHIAYCRAVEGEVAEPRITRHSWDEAGRHVADQDPRFAGTGSPLNTTTIHSLSGVALLQQSVDTGWKLTLSGAAGQLLDSWDARGSSVHVDYDPMFRPASFTEKPADGEPAIVERFTYGDSSTESAHHNQCGQLIRHDDPAGTVLGCEFGLAGGLLLTSRRLLLSLQLPDWPESVIERDLLLEAGEGYFSSAVVDALAEAVQQTDPAGNRRTSSYGVSGQLQESRIELAGTSAPQRLVSAIAYSASGQVLAQTFGNGVIREITYEPASGRTARITAKKANGTLLSDLNYQYDPAGNVVHAEDASQRTRFAGNQKIEPVSHYRYNTLYQLIEASGREVSPGASHGPALPDAIIPIPDPNHLANYSQTYRYDAGGNLLEMHHAGGQAFTRKMDVAPDSNRSLPHDETDADFASGFDTNGNLQQLVRGQTLEWDVRNQLRLVTTVRREEGANDDEHYIYDSGGQRLRKITKAQASGRTLVSEVRYLDGLEIRNQPDGEILEVATVQAGGSSVRILHWKANKPEGIDDNQVRYELSDHLGSSTLELDDQGGVITREGYYPFGGTAWWTARSGIEAKYRTVRYGGKERDATGLYYYGMRYYAPWLQRWINPDPQGSADGLNVYCFVSNSPVSKFDTDGLEGMDANRAATVLQSHIRRFISPIKVKTLTEGVIGVSIKGDNAVFAKVGIELDREAAAPRELTYLALSSSLRGKVSGGDAAIPLSRAAGAQIAAASGSMPAAYVNGGYFNMGARQPMSGPLPLPSPQLPNLEYASVGRNVIDSLQKPFIDPPEDYSSAYSKLQLGDGSFIHVAPKLTTRGAMQFSRRDSLKAKHIYGEETGHVGALGHASDPNARSAISLAENDTTRTRLAIALNPGRGTFSRKTDEPGFTMLEWATVMARLDNLNPKNEAGLPAASSWNLDGGDSSTLGVLDPDGKHLLQVHTLKYGRSGVKSARPIGNFLTFHR